VVLPGGVAWQNHTLRYLQLHRRALLLLTLNNTYIHQHNLTIT
jgi:hypothetical protein